MIKLITPVSCTPLADRIRLDDDITLLGSCFVDNIAARLQDAGFKAHNNPFGTIYNPASIAGAVHLLDSGRMFTEEDCVQMGAGVDKICSFYHHTSFARPTTEEFLANANEALLQAREDWHKSKWVIITLGTAFVWTHSGKVVSNCLKRPGTEFEHFMLSIEDVKRYLTEITDKHPEKRFIFTVSPIRHLSDGAHSNTLSKSTLHLALSQMNVDYFPAYEILMDELRDYRFYADDLVHPSATAVDIIWERFLDYATDENERSQIEQNEKTSRGLKHVRRT